MIRILVVEDDELTRRFIETAMGGPDRVIQTVGDGHAALKLLSQKGFDVLVTDIYHPGPSGLRLISRIRSNPKLKHLRIMVVSGHARGEKVQAAKECGADDVRAKPFDPQKFRKDFEQLMVRAA